MNARRATVRLSIAGVDASRDIAPGLLSFIFTDQASGQADDLCVTLEDRDHLWKGPWRPEKQDVLEASITARDWFGQGQHLELPCGAYEVDEIECSGPPDVVRIKGSSTAVSSSLRREKKTKAFENTTLEAVAADIAAANGLELLYEAQAFSITRVDQREESDLAFLQRLAKKYGLNCKVSDTQLILFAGQIYDAKEPVAVIRRGEAWISRFSFRDQSHEQFKDCECSYWEPEEKELRSGKFSCPGTAPSGQTLKINQRCESLAEAEAVAQNNLRQKNKQEKEGSLDLAGDPRLVAGSTVIVTGFGAYDGTYFIEQATHSVSRGSGYTTKITIRQTLEY